MSVGVCRMAVLSTLCGQDFPPMFDETESAPMAPSGPCPPVAPGSLISPCEWGSSHCAVLMHVAFVTEQCGAFQIGLDPRMRSTRTHLIALSEGCAFPTRMTWQRLGRNPVMEPRNGTRLKGSLVVGWHDDWCCLRDLIAEGLVGAAGEGTQEEVRLDAGNRVAPTELGREMIGALGEFSDRMPVLNIHGWPADALSLLGYERV